MNGVIKYLFIRTNLVFAQSLFFPNYSIKKITNIEHLLSSPQQSSSTVLDNHRLGLFSIYRLT